MNVSVEARLSGNTSSGFCSSFPLRCCLSHISFEFFLLLLWLLLTQLYFFFTWLSLFSWTRSSATLSNLKKIPLKWLKLISTVPLDVELRMKFLKKSKINRKEEEKKKTNQKFRKEILRPFINATKYITI